MMRSLRLLRIARMITETPGPRVVPKSVLALRNLSTSDSSSSSNVFVTQSKAAPFDKPSSPFGKDRAEEEKVVLEACGDLDEDDDDEMEEEEMFVDADPSFEHQLPEWGGPRRGGRLPEPTRYGDWERKGRCTDF